MESQKGRGDLYVHPQWTLWWSQWTIYSTESITASLIDVDDSLKHKVDQKRKLQMDMYSMIPLIWPLNKYKTILYIVSYVH